MKLIAKNLPPGPYDVHVNTSGFAYVVDANGRKIATLLGTDKVKSAVAALLIKAREAVRVPVPACETTTPPDIIADERGKG